jgi:hypothetical protein
MRKSTIILTTATALCVGDAIGVTRANRRARKIISKKNAHIEGLALRLLSIMTLMQNITNGVSTQDAIARFVEESEFIAIVTEKI